MRGLSIQRRQNGVLRKCPPPIRSARRGERQREQVVREGIAAERRLQIFGQAFFRCRLDDNGQGSLPERRPSAHAERQYAQISRGDGCVRLHTEHRPQERTAHTSRRKTACPCLFYGIRERMCGVYGLLRSRSSKPSAEPVCSLSLIACGPQQRQQRILGQQRPALHRGLTASFHTARARQAAGTAHRTRDLRLSGAFAAG